MRNLIILSALLTVVGMPIIVTAQEEPPEWFIVTLHDISPDSYAYHSDAYGVDVIVESSLHPNDSYLLFSEPNTAVFRRSYTGEIHTNLTIMRNGDKIEDDLYVGANFYLIQNSANSYSFQIIWEDGMLITYFVNWDFQFNEGWYAYVVNENAVSQPIRYPRSWQIWTGGYGGHVTIQPGKMGTFTDYAAVAKVYNDGNMTIEQFSEIIQYWLTEV